MKEAFKVWQTSRNVYLRFLDNYSTEQLNYIPEGLSNNLIWNIGHIIVVQQALVYKLSGLPMNVSDEIFERYKNGSQPNSNTTLEEIQHIRKLLLESVPKTIDDYNAGAFKSYQEFTTTTGFNLTSIEEAITFNNFHEGTHLGFMLKIKKFL